MTICWPHSLAWTHDMDMSWKGPALKTSWWDQTFENVMNICWQGLEDVLNMCWKHVGNVLNMYWQGLEDVLNMCCKRVGNVLNMYWQGLDDVLNMCCIRVGNVLNMYWHIVFWELQFKWIHWQFFSAANWQDRLCFACARLSTPRYWRRLCQNHEKKWLLESLRKNNFKWEVSHHGKECSILQVQPPAVAQFNQVLPKNLEVEVEVLFLIFLLDRLTQNKRLVMLQSSMKIRRTCFIWRTPYQNTLLS